MYNASPNQTSLEFRGREGGIIQEDSMRVESLLTVGWLTIMFPANIIHDVINADQLDFLSIINLSNLGRYPCSPHTSPQGETHQVDIPRLSIGL